MTIQLQKLQQVCNTSKMYNTSMTIQLQKVQYTYDNRTAKSTIDV